MKQLITFDHVSFQYQTEHGPAIPAVRDVSLTIHEGEYVAVIGANGSGKSTFSRLVNALLLPDEGSIRIDGLETSHPDNLHRIHTTIGMVFQYPEDQIVSTTVEEDVAFGPENLALPPEEVRRRVENALLEAGLLELRRRPPHLLSAGQTQRLALAGVLAMHPRCIIFDEASTMLDPAGRRWLMDTMRSLHERGTTIISVTHFMDEAAIASRVVVFDRGRIALDGPPAEIFSDPARLIDLHLDLPPAGRVAAALRYAIPDLPRTILTLPELLAALPAFPGRSTAGALSTRVPAEGDPGDTAGQPVVAVEGLGYTYMHGTPLEQRALDDIDFHVDSGQAAGLLGMTGSGKSTLMQHLNGLLRPQEGKARVGDFDLTDPRVDRRQIVRMVGLVFQNPENQFFEYYVGDEISFGPRQLKIETPLAERVRWAMEQVGLDFEMYKDRPLYTLSGGERRKVALASTLALKPSVLLLDEPTAGLDPFSRRELLNRLALMRDSGLTLLLSSHRMEDLSILTSSLTVLHRGRKVMNGATAEIFVRQEELRSYGMVSPVSVQVAAVMRSKGWPLPVNVLTSDMLRKSALAAVEAVRE